MLQRGNFIVISFAVIAEPVCSLLFSGSSDGSVKVWDVASSCTQFSQGLKSTQNWADLHKPAAFLAPSGVFNTSVLLLFYLGVDTTAKYSPRRIYMEYLN